MGQKKVGQTSPPRPPRVVLDTNIFISAVLFSGRMGQLVKLWQEGRILVLMSPEVLKEYVKVLAYPKFKLAKQEIKSVIEQELLPFVEPVKVSKAVRVIAQDPSDDKFFSLALGGKSDFIISGDKHLLGLKEFQGIKIVTAEEFLSGLT
jgi:putative PIN family toxin of toxin-antitoxin system